MLEFFGNYLIIGCFVCAFFMVIHIGADMTGHVKDADRPNVWELGFISCTTVVFWPVMVVYYFWFLHQYMTKHL